MIVDVHAHHFPEAYFALVDRLGDSAIGPLRAPPPEPLTERFARMDEAGVALQVLSPTVAPYTPDEGLGVRAARMVNEAYAELAGRHPDRFRMWTSLPLPHVEPALAEIAHGFEALGAQGVTLHCFCLGGSLARPEFDPVWAALDERAAIVFLHPCQNGACSPLINDWGLTVCAGASIEDALVALHLIAARIPERFPRVRFIVPHFGGLLPMLLPRLDGQMPQRGLTEKPSVTARRLFYDTVGWGSRAALLAAVEAFGAGQLVTGSDYPILLRHESYAQTFAHIREAGLAPETAEQILSNAARLLGLGREIAA